MGRKKENYCYTCPRCGYETRSMTCINRHLYKRKKPCAVKIKDIDLTEDVKQNVLVNRVYTNDTPLTHTTTNNIIIHNNISFNNIVNGMDVIDKLTKYIDHKKMYLIPLEDYVSSRFEPNKEDYSKDDLCQMVHDVTNANGKLEEMNVLYDEDKQSIKIYDKDDDNYCNKTWFEKDIASGIQSIVRRLQLYCWDVYENFLIRSIEKQGIDYSKKLDEYYKFIGTIEVEPFAYDKNDNQLMFSPDDDEYFKGHSRKNKLSLKYYELYKMIRDSITTQDKIQLFAIIFGRIKEVNLENINVLNKTLCDLIGVDKEFNNKMTN